MMSDNCYGREQVGAAKQGSALLAGILRCRRCGRKLMVRYTGKRPHVLRWNEALRRLQDVELRIDQHNRQQAALVRPTKEQFEHLAGDLETVWNSPTTDVRLKKRIVRTLIHEVIADVDPDRANLFQSFIGKAVSILSCMCAVGNAVRMARKPQRMLWGQ